MKTINGQIFKEMMISGTNNLYNHYPEIDALNVFPVPDGDTGMNMNLTLSSGAKEIENRNDSSVSDMAKAFSKGLLMGARGNSGVITSQIFRGFAKGVEGKQELDAVAFAEGLVNGTQVAYKAVLKPVEGTILTVIRESSDALLNKVSEEDSIEKAFQILIKAAKVSLAHTPELLPVLKEVGVVDSGGAGLIKIFEGMESAIKGKIIEKKELVEIDSLANAEGDDNGYCVEYVLNIGGEDKKIFNAKKFEGALEKYGTVKDLNIAKEQLYLHIHTQVPGSLITFSLTFGEFKDTKLENLKLRHTDSGFELDEVALENEPLKEYGIVAVSAGKGIDEYFKEIGVDVIVSGGQTMNPSTEDFVQAIKKVHAKHIFLLPNNSNIILAAEQATKVIDKEFDARVITTKTIPEGLVAAMNFNPDDTVENNLETMSAAVENIKSGSVTYAIRDTDIDGVHVTKDYYMGMKGKQILSCEKDKLKTLFTLLGKMIDEDSAIITILVGEDVKDEEIDFIQAKVTKKYPDLDLDVRRGDQPVYSFFVGVE